MRAGVTWEQGQFNDVMFSMLLGAPLLGWTAVRDCRTQQVRRLLGDPEGSVTLCCLSNVRRGLGARPRCAAWSGMGQRRTPQVRRCL